MTEFQNDYRYMLDVMANRKPRRLPLYEHIICPEIMEEILDVEFAELIDGDSADQKRFFNTTTASFKR